MANLTLVPTAQDVTITITSMELVQLINNMRDSGGPEIRHDNFMAKVPKVLCEKDALHSKGIYKDAYGREKPCYHFKKREACLMAMSYSYDLQAKVFDKMTALEAATAVAPTQFQIPRTLAAALRLAADQQDQIEAQQLELKKAQPKVELVDNFLSTVNGKTGNQVAKELAKEYDIGRNRLYAILRKQKVFNENNEPYQKHVDAGRFYLQPDTYITEHGIHQCTSVRFTAKGEFHCRALLNSLGFEKRAA